MELRQLRYLVSAARCGSVKGAAHDNHVTPPAVSVQLKHLEEELGDKLFTADRRGVHLTQTGIVVRAQAEDILRRIDSLRQTVEDRRLGTSGFLKLGNIDAASVYVLPSVFRAFRKEYPGVDVQVVVADSSQLLRALEREDLELAIVTLPTASDGYVEVPIYEEDLLVVAHPRHPLAGKRAVPLTQVAHQGIIAYPARSTTRGLIDRIFWERGLRVRTLMEISSPEAMRELSEAGLGASVLPRPVVAEALRAGRLGQIRVAGPPFRRTLGITYKDEERLSPAGRAFLRLAKQHLRLSSSDAG